MMSLYFLSINTHFLNLLLPSFPLPSTMKSISSELTSQVLFQLADPKSYRQISHTTGLSSSTISRLCALHLPTHLKASGGRPKKISARALHHITHSVTNG